MTDIYFGICWASIGISVSLLAIGLWNASLALSEKGFYAMAFLLALFASVAVQKNVRDINLADEISPVPNNTESNLTIPRQSKAVPRQTKVRPTQEGRKKTPAKG